MERSLLSPTAIFSDVETRTEKKITAKSFTVYKVLVKSGDSNWYIYRRYNDFYDLHQKLHKLFPQEKLHLPPKRLLNNFDPSFIESRRKGLQNYVVSILSSPVLSRSPLVRQFLTSDVDTSGQSLSSVLRKKSAGANAGNRKSEVLDDDSDERVADDGKDKGRTSENGEENGHDLDDEEAQHRDDDDEEEDDDEEDFGYGDDDADREDDNAYDFENGESYASPPDNIPILPRIGDGSGGGVGGSDAGTNGISEKKSAEAEPVHQVKSVLSSSAPVTSDTTSSVASTAVPTRPPKSSDMTRSDSRKRRSRTPKPSLDDFYLLNVIGKGSFGKVMVAKHKRNGRIFAIKVLSKKAIKQRDEVKHIMSERNVLRKNLRHPFLIGLYYSFQTAERLYFVLDYVNGGELFFHLQRDKRFPEQRARFYAAEIFSALEYLHSKEIIYRDLKPENILLDHEGHVVLTDFGLAKEGMQYDSTTSTFCGTPEYLAPEVIKKQSYGKAVDWWALGVVLYEMLVGLPPFYSRDCNEMYSRILNDRLRFPSHVNEPAKDFISQLLNRDPLKRLGSGPLGSEEVKHHPFFDGVDWQKLYHKEYRPPYNPNVNGELDLKNFDKTFTSEPIPLNLMDDTNHQFQVDVTIDDTFEGFSFSAEDPISTAVREDRNF